MTNLQKHLLVSMLSGPQTLSSADARALAEYVVEHDHELEEGRRPDGGRYVRKICRYRLNVRGQVYARQLENQL